MSIVSLEPYVWLKWLHVLSSAVLFGAGLGTAFQLWSAHRSRKAKAIFVVARNAVKADWRFTLPAGIVQPATGLGLAIVTSTPVNAPWLIVSYVLYLVALACWVPAVVLQIQARDLAEESVVSGAPLRYAYHQAMKHWFVLAWPGFGALVLIFLLMIAKPQFW
jgi:uncharacterized membrane protein